MVSCQRLAEKVGSNLSSLITDLPGNVVMAVTGVGTVNAVELSEPYGQMNYAWGTMPTAHTYPGQRLESQSGLLYYNFRWYDPLAGIFVRTDTRQTNAQGFNPYASVNDNPETKNDPSGHCWPICAITAAVGFVSGAVVGVVTEAAQHGTDFRSYNWGHIAVDAVAGTAAGFMMGTGVGAAIGIGMITGGFTSGVGAIAHHKSWGEVVQSTFEGAAIGGI